MHTLIILNPGHFHAALVLRQSHPLVNDDIHVYSEKGADLDRFMQMAASFNERAEDPTSWRLHIYEGEDFLQRTIDEMKGDIVVMAGRNDRRMEEIERLSRAGFFVLADKPWLICEEVLPLLRSAMAPDRPFCLDIMTERFEITTLLQKEFLKEPGVFGAIRVDDDNSPSVFKESIHHLYKIVNGQPLVRPPWYFDIDIQGDGITDVTTHLVDMTHWMLFPGASINYDEDIELVEARRWPTLVPRDKYALITKEDRFDENVQGDVTEDGLNYFSNGEIFYRVKGVPVHVRVIWNLEAPEGKGDMHRSLIKGTRSDLVIRQLPERDFKVELLIAPRTNPDEVEKAVGQCLEKLTDRHPGLSRVWEEDKIRIEIPDELRTTHEEHFCQVRDTYLDYLNQASVPPETRACIVSKYTLLAEARKLALNSPFLPLERG